jgi:hypothetical protein
MGATSDLAPGLFIVMMLIIIIIVVVVMKEIP